MLQNDQTQDHNNIEDEKINHTYKLEKEFGGPKGLEPTRYGLLNPEWEVKGRVSDF
jgi:hypothetical protein